MEYVDGENLIKIFEKLKNMNDKYCVNCAHARKTEEPNLYVCNSNECHTFNVTGDTIICSHFIEKVQEG